MTARTFTCAAYFASEVPTGAILSPAKLGDYQSAAPMDSPVCVNLLASISTQ